MRAWVQAVQVPVQAPALRSYLVYSHTRYFVGSIEYVMHPKLFENLNDLSFVFESELPFQYLMMEETRLPYVDKLTRHLVILLMLNNFQPIVVLYTYTYLHDSVRCW